MTSLLDRLRDAFDHKLAELHVRQSLALGAHFGEPPEQNHCQFCDAPQVKATLCAEHWQECAERALASIHQRRGLRQAQKGAVGLCPHCHNGRERYACGHCGASGKQALEGFVFCPDCHGGGLKYGHTPCSRCQETGILTEQALYASLAPAQADALREALAADDIIEPRLCHQLSDLGWALHVSLYFGEHSYKSYSVDPAGQISVVGG